MRTREGRNKRWQKERMVKVVGECLAAMTPVFQVQKVSLKCMMSGHAFRKVASIQEFKNLSLLKPCRAGLGRF